MPVFFFDLCTRGRLEADEAGLELASAEAAYLEACAAIPGLTSELLRARASYRPSHLRHDLFLPGCN